MSALYDPSFEKRQTSGANHTGVRWDARQHNGNVCADDKAGPPVQFNTERLDQLRPSLGDLPAENNHFRIDHMHQTGQSCSQMHHGAIDDPRGHLIRFGRRYPTLTAEPA